MPAIGITGGISTGKSTFCNCLLEVVPSAKFFDADLAAHSLAELPEVREEILHQFGSGVFSRGGDLNRAKLRAIVFGSAAKRRALEQILHPRIRRQWMAQAEKHRNSPDFFFADIPLLYETGGEKWCERVIVVACSCNVQLSRLAKRKSLKGAEAEQMINSQMALENKIKRADHVVWNNGDRATLLEQAKSLVTLWQE
jgi:dephospho-CoA kinase